MENQVQKFKKHSRTGSIISAIGLVVILLSVIVFIYIFSNKEKEKAHMKQLIDTAESHIIKKDSGLVILQDSLINIKQIIQEDKVECNAIPLNKKMPNGSPGYKFTLRIKDPILNSKLKSVDYFFDHPSFNLKHNKSSNSHDNFQVSYKGWGCLDTIQIYLHYKSSSKIDTIFFPMCNKTKIELKQQ